MSIFTTPVSKLVTADLKELLSEQAVENVRLEFKRDVPDKDETLKKLSSFANTLGGYVVVGAAAGNDGRITALSGVPTQPSYKQTLVQWCFGGVTPPLDFEVSDPIPMEAPSKNVCYVIAIGESDVAPHALNGRKGIYVRTDEFSSRFQAQPATETELRQMFQRRQIVRDRRASLVERARDRFHAFKEAKYQEFGRRPNGIGAWFDLAIGPRFPSHALCDQAELLNLVQTNQFAWRGVGFPRTTGGGLVSQHESAIVLRPGSSFSILEANFWGMLYYASEIELHEHKYEGIHVYHFVAQLQVFLRHAEIMFRQMGYTGTLSIELRMTGIRGVPWIYSDGFSGIYTGPTSSLDDRATFELETTTYALTDTPDRVSLDLLRYVFFAVNWADLAQNAARMKDMVKFGYNYNYSDPDPKLRF
jgi:hypothetical protein